MERDEAQFDPDGRDPELVALWQSTARFTGMMTFRRNDVPPGVWLADFWSTVLSDAKSVWECAEMMRAFVEGRAPVLPADRHLTQSQKWRRHTEQQKREAEQRAALFDAGLKRYLEERESQRGPDDAFVRFMRLALDAARRTSQPAEPAHVIDLLDPALLQGAVDQALRHYVQEREAEVGPDDEFCVYMRSTLPSAAVLQFPGRRAKGEMK